jgi:cellulose synthase/poly-beta-1,6-N-acetylglucosamine synthase-like glycosyltransferase
MISIILTAFKEEKTIAKAIESIIGQELEDYQLLISSPDINTLMIAKEYAKKNKNIKLFKDPGKGKSYALNLILKKVKGDIIILTDGDVFVSQDSINEIMKIFNKDSRYGCISGRPVPQESRNTKYGYWANFLFDSAHRLRKNLYKNGKFLECSGYLWAFKNNIITNIPLDVAEDTVVPFLFNEKGYKIGYAESAKVYVKNVDNWEDWIKQKTRTTKAHETLSKHVDITSAPRTKSFFNEAFGVFSLFLYPRSLKEFLWSLELFFARLYMWIKVIFDTKIKNKTYQDGWERINSTK